MIKQSSPIGLIWILRRSKQGALKKRCKIITNQCLFRNQPNYFVVNRQRKVWCARITTLQQIAATHLSGILVSFSLWSEVSSLPSNGSPGWRHRPTRPILFITRRWTTVAHIFRNLKIHRKSRKNRTTIIFSPVWSKQKGLFWRLRKN